MVILLAVGLPTDTVFEITLLFKQLTPLIVAVITTSPFPVFVRIVELPDGFIVAIPEFDVDQATDELHGRFDIEYTSEPEQNVLLPLI